MLQAHSFLWHYLWLAPHLLSLILVAALLSRSDFRRRYPFFCASLLFASLEGLCLYIFDVSPRVAPITWWRTFWGGTVAEGILKFAVIGELLHHLLHNWPSIAKLGRNLVSGAGAVLVLLAAVVAAFAAPDNTPWIVGSSHVLSETIYLAAAGLIVSIFLVAAFFRIPWDRTSFGIALGAAVVWCEHLAIWALISGGVVRNRGWEDLANMGTYHASVLIWGFFLLMPPKDPPGPNPPDEPPSSGVGPEDPEESLDEWNRELERLIHQ